jgi:hypothetical protein
VNSLSGAEVPSRGLFLFASENALDEEFVERETRDVRQVCIRISGDFSQHLGLDRSRQNIAKIEGFDRCDELMQWFSKRFCIGGGSQKAPDELEIFIPRQQGHAQAVEIRSAVCLKRNGVEARTCEAGHLFLAFYRIGTS